MIARMQLVGPSHQEWRPIEVLLQSYRAGEQLRFARHTKSIGDFWGVSGLDVVAEAKSALSRGMIARETGEPARPEGPHPLPDMLRSLVLGARRAGASGRLIRWSAYHGEIEWAEVRWRGAPCSTTGVSVYVGLPEGRSGLINESLSWEGLSWAEALLSALGKTLGPDPSHAPLRPVRLVFGPESLWHGDRGGLPLAWEGTSRSVATAEVSLGSTCSLESKGFWGDLLRWTGRSVPNAEVRYDVPPRQTRILYSGEGAFTAIALLLVAALTWWRRAGTEEAFHVLDWLQGTLPSDVYQRVSRHPLGGQVHPEMIFSRVLECRLAGLWQLSALFGKDADGEKEVAGWTREMEAAVRSERQPRSVPGDMRRAQAVDAELDASFQGGERTLDPGGVFVLREHVTPSPSTAGNRIDPAGLTPLLRRQAAEILNGERTLAEAFHHLVLEHGMEWDDARRLLSGWAQQQLMVKLARPSHTGTVLYFSYGSCMCRPSFRETVPRFDLLGAAKLPGYRLAFTYESIVRSGGVADILPQPGGDVWGVLYRIPRVYLNALDEREGVHLGYYERTWISVTALGRRFTPVLTYTVTQKAASEIAPSPEYAGLIVDGAGGLLSEEYYRRLLEIFAGFGIEPALPL